MNDIFHPEIAMFSAGCFWGVQYYFDQVPGVTRTLVGYTGGDTENPTYEQVCIGQTGHAEAIYIEFNPAIVSYETLVRHFFRMHNPTQLNRQGPDIGTQYRSAIFYSSNKQFKIASKIIKELAPKYQKPIVTELSKAEVFWEAEDYHQKFTERTGQGMCHIPYEPLS